MNARSRGAIRDTLAKHYSRVDIAIINTMADLEALVVRRPDVVFLGRNAIPLGSGSVWLSHYLEIHSIAHTGSRRAAHKLGLNKHLAKQCLLDAGLATSRYSLVPVGKQYVQNNGLVFPLFVKPTNRGGGAGIDARSIVHNVAELNAKVAALALDMQADALIEEYLPGREFSVAILRHEQSSELTAMPIELAIEANADGSQLLDSSAKSDNREQISAVDNPELRSSVCKLAIDAFNALGARDFGRVDIRLDAAGVPHFLEINLVPSLIEGYGSFPKACLLNERLGYEDMILTIIRLALERTESDGRDFVDYLKTRSTTTRMSVTGVLRSASGFEAGINSMGEKRYSTFTLPLEY